MDNTENEVKTPVQDEVTAPAQAEVKEEVKPVRHRGFTKENAKELGRKGGLKGRRTGIPAGKTARGHMLDVLYADKKCIHPAELNEALQKELGISLNPLREMERMLRTGGLSNRDRITILKTLTEYTHQKRPSIQKVDTTVKAEDFLKALADEINGETE